MRSDALGTLPLKSERSKPSDLEKGEKGIAEEHRRPRRKAVIRFEVHDTGIGLENRLVAM